MSWLFNIVQGCYRHRLLCKHISNRFLFMQKEIRQVFFFLVRVFLFLSCKTMISVMCHSTAGLANKFLSWSVFVPLGRLTYIGYLLHPVLIYRNYYGQQRGVYVDGLNMVSNIVIRPYEFLPNTMRRYCFMLLYFTFESLTLLKVLFLCVVHTQGTHLIIVPP